MPQVRQEFESDIGTKGDIVRVALVRDGKRVVAFVVQYEAWLDETHRPVVRFDTAHGFAHRDILDWQGQTIRWERMPDVNYATALTRAIADIKEEWERYRTDFLRRRP